MNVLDRLGDHPLSGLFGSAKAFSRLDCSAGAVRESIIVMSETRKQSSEENKPSQLCAWCGKPAASKCSQCGHLWVCGRECFKKVYRTHGRVCTRIRKKPYVTSPESSMYGVGELDFEVAHRGLKGEYYLGEGGKPMMREPYDSEEDRPDYLLVLPGVARKLVIEYMDVRSLRNTDMVVNNVYTLMAWHEALRGVFSVALSKWPLYQSTDDFKGLRWCMNRRVQVRNFKIWKVVDKQSGTEIRKEPERIFEVLCKSKKYADIASLMVRSGSIDPNSVGSFGRLPLHYAANYGRLDAALALVEAGADIDKAMEGGCTPFTGTCGRRPFRRWPCTPGQRSQRRGRQSGGPRAQ